MKKNKLIVRAATENDYPDIARLLDATFHPIPYEKRLKLWRWRYNDNPAKNDVIPPFLVGDQDGEIVGVHGLTPLRVKIKSELLYSGCSCDLAVNRSARSAGMKIKLRAMSKEVTHLPLSTSANEPANKITLSLGGKEFTPARRKFIKPMKLSGLIRKKAAAKAGSAVGAIAGLIAKPADWFVGKKVKARGNGKYIVEKILRFDTRFDQLWNTLSAQYQNIVVRDSAYLNWRYVCYPFPGVQSFGLYQDKALKGFAAIHSSIDDDGLPFISILELITDKTAADGTAVLLQEIFNRAVRAGVDTIIAKAATEDLERLFLNNGFRVRAMAFSPFTYKNNTDMPDEQFDTMSNWFTSLGDGDACYFFD